MIEESRAATDWFVYHDLGEETMHRTVVETASADYHEAPDDPPSGWPEVCPVCGVGDLHRSRMGYHFYRNPATGEEKRHVWDFGIGAMFDADWLPWKGPDGLSLSVVLPPGGQADVWHIDGPAGGTDRRPWTRTGTPPNVSVTPSIKTDRYHSHLTGGVLLDG